MQNKLAAASLIALNIFWGILMGAVVYSHLIFFPVFLSNLPDSASIVNAEYGFRDAPFWMSIHPVMLVLYVIALGLNWKNSFRRNVIVISLAVYVVVLIITGIYFVPELLAFVASPESNVSPAEWLVRGQRWQIFSWIREAFLHGIQIMLLYSLTKPMVRADVRPD